MNPHLFFCLIISIGFVNVESKMKSRRHENIAVPYFRQQLIHLRKQVVDAIEEMDKIDIPLLNNLMVAEEIISNRLSQFSDLQEKFDEMKQTVVTSLDQDMCFNKLISPFIYKETEYNANVVQCVESLNSTFFEDCRKIMVPVINVGRGLVAYLDDLRKSCEKMSNPFDYFLTEHKENTKPKLEAFFKQVNETNYMISSILRSTIAKTPCFQTAFDDFSRHAETTRAAAKKCGEK